MEGGRDTINPSLIPSHRDEEGRESRERERERDASAISFLYSSRWIMGLFDGKRETELLACLLPSSSGDCSSLHQREQNTVLCAVRC